MAVFYREIISRYLPQEYLVRQKALALFYTFCIASVLMLGILAKDLLLGPFSPWFYVLIDGVIILQLVLGSVFIYRGYYKKVTMILFPVLSIVLILATLRIGLSERPEEFYMSFVRDFPVVIVVAGLFCSGPVLLLVSSMLAAWIPMYWVLFCSNLGGLPAIMAKDSVVECLVMVLVATIVSYFSSRMTEHALRQAQIELAANHALRQTLEDRVLERTAALEVSRAQAEEASKAKGEFLANMSHEIRTPLNGILGMAEILSRSHLDAKQREQLNTIVDSGQHLASVIQNVLDYSRIEAGKEEISHGPVSLREILRSVTGMMQFKAEEKGIVFEVQLDDAISPVVIGDELHLRQVLINLLGNAIKFTERGSVRLLIKAVSEGKVAFEVSDSGPGMSPDQVEHLFERFYQVDAAHTRKAGGTGLGLTISKNLVEAMGGQLEVESSLGKGSTFRFVLGMRPVAEKAAQPVVEVQAEIAEVLRPGLILMAEDNAVNQKVAGLMLQQLGMKVEVVGDGLAALERMAREPLPDIILMDCQMPHMDGYGASQEIRGWKNSLDAIKKKASQVPIIALTADVMQGTRNRCLEAGMDDYLTKPFLADRVKAVLAHWQSKGRQS